MLHIMLNPHNDRPERIDLPVAHLRKCYTSCYILTMIALKGRNVTARGGTKLTPG